MCLRRHVLQDLDDHARKLCLDGMDNLQIDYISHLEDKFDHFSFMSKKNVYARTLGNTGSLFSHQSGGYNIGLDWWGRVSAASTPAQKSEVPQEQESSIDLSEPDGDVDCYRKSDALKLQAEFSPCNFKASDGGFKCIYLPMDFRRFPKRRVFDCHQERR